MSADVSRWLDIAPLTASTVMRSVVLAVLATAAQLTAVPAISGPCAKPALTTEVPDGMTATRDLMLSAQRAIKAYDVAVRAYVDCLREAGDTSDRSTSAVADLVRLEERFNVELRVFKTRNGGT